MAKTIAFFVTAVFLLSVFSIAFAAAQNQMISAGNQTGKNVSELIHQWQELKNETKEAREEIISAVKEKLQEKLREHNGTLNVSGKNITIKELSEEQKEIIAEKINAKTGLNLTAEDIDNKTILRALLSNGRWAQVKIMPNVASAVALAKMRAKCAERNCTVELKEVGMGNKTKLAYEIQTEKNSTLLFFLKNKMMVKAQVDAETGEIISVKKPWWAFMASEKDESVSEETNRTETNETA